MAPLITIEGIEGCGKTTQVGLLAAALRAQGWDVVSTREPGGTTLGRGVRALLSDPTLPIDPLAELLLFLADRAQHVGDVIRPALNAGRAVISDRFADSTVAYQGYGRQTDPALVRRLAEVAQGGLVPDLTFVLDCPVDVGLTRTEQRCRESVERLEQEPRAFHDLVRKGFLEIARGAPERITVIDATASIADVHHEIVAATQRRLPRAAK